MRLDINRRLYDVALRQAIYVERIKAAQFLEFNKTMNQLNTEFSQILYRTKYKTLDALTKAELNNLLLALRASQSKIYNNYTTQAIKHLEAFMKADLMVSQITLASILAGRTLSEDESLSFIEENKQKDNGFLLGFAAATTKPDLLWSGIRNAPIPANGNLPEALILGFAATGSAAMENIIRMGYANKYSVDEVIALAVESDSVQGGSSLSKKLIYQNKSVTDTVISDVHALTYSGVASLLFTGYMWHSIMDGRTTDICIGRNNKVYVYGKGPLPPAHYRCRSMVVPFSGAFSGDTMPDSLYDWLLSQPEDVQRDMFNDSELEVLKQTGKFTASKGLNLEQYRNKISEILK